MKNLIYILSITFIFFSCKPQNQEKNFEKDLKTELNKIVAEAEIPGANLAIAMPQNKIITISSGFSDKEKQISMKAEDKMFSGSTGKTFCAAIILQLMDEGKLNMDDKLSVFFGNEEWFNKLPNASEITIRMLLNHTTGLPRYAFHDSLWRMLEKNPDKIWTGVERLSYVFDSEPVHKANKGWAYSDTNYILLGMLIEKLTGNEYYAELKKRILTPMNLQNTSPGNSRRIEGLISGYTSLTKELYIPEKVLSDEGLFAFNPQMEFTGGGIACTSSDLAKWGRFYYGGKVFSKEALSLMKEPCPQKTNLDDNAGYGFAAVVWNNNQQVSYGHTGFFPGYVTIFEYIPEYDVCIGMQWNTDKKKPGKSLHQYLNEVRKVVASYL